MRFLLYLPVVILTACQNLSDSTPASHMSTTVDTTAFPGFLASRETVREFYRLRENKLYWFSSVSGKASADSVLLTLAKANHLGVHREDYHYEKLQSLLGDTLDMDRYAAADPLLTDAWITLYVDLKSGRLNPKTLERLDRKSEINHKAIALLQTLDHNTIMTQLREAEPSHKQYVELKRQLQSLLLSDTRDPVHRSRAQQIALNMERWRWQQSALPDRYVSVNIPSYMLRVFEDDSLWLESRVIVGKRETPTPVMESVIRSFIIYPYWHAPYSIATKEILPHLQKERTYLARNNFEVLDRNGRVILDDTIQWDYYTKDYFPFILRQREGSENSMGIIKFVFANNYNVYLHDTNSKRLFANTRRDLSHGCVRVSNAVAFAHYLVRDDDIYVSPEDLDQYLSLQQRLTINLRKPIKLRLEYFTVEVNAGKASFYEDIYKKDSVMLQHLQPRSEIERETRLELATLSLGS